MRRVLAIARSSCSSPSSWSWPSASGAGGDGGGYQVRAIFDNAFYVDPGRGREGRRREGREDRVARRHDGQQGGGRPEITEPRLPGLPRATPTCTIRPQSLIGEKFVECMPTQPRPAGTPAPPAAEDPGRRRARAEHLLPVEQHEPARSTSTCSTTSCACPTASASRSSSTSSAPGSPGAATTLRQVIRNADPALKQTDKVLAILADQNQTLAASPTTPTRCSRRSRASASQVADFIDRAERRSARRPPSSARRSSANLELFPPFLRAAARRRCAASARFADQATPVLADLSAVGADVSRSSSSSGRSRRPAIAGLHVARRRRRRRRARRSSDAEPIDQATSGSSRSGASRWRSNLDEAHASLRRHRRHRAADGLHLLLGGRRPTASTRSGTTCARACS